MKKEILIIENGRKRLYGILFTPELPAPYPLVIGCHGFDGSHVSKLDYGEYLAERGFAFYAFDYFTLYESRFFHVFCLKVDRFVLSPQQRIPSCFNHLIHP